jgi:hypothetical protein
MHSASLSSGTILLAPFASAVAMVEVARNTSMITTILVLTSYNCNNAGDRQVYNKGFCFFILSV